MKWTVIRHLLKVMWMFYRDKLMLGRIIMSSKTWYIDLYTREHYEEMFLVKEEPNERGN